ncbi:uncharacterized protein PG998_000107 [Apiospora kogelbergensis]|uniref:uncharacterized protein n=1 Tax=Apiospora kogelbergensis TaxID=1337665 RepID=UPI00312D7CC9
MSANAVKLALGMVRQYAKEDTKGEQGTLKRALTAKVKQDAQKERLGTQLFGQSAQEAWDTYEGMANCQETNAFLEITDLDEVCNSLQQDWDKVVKLIPEEERQDMPTKPSIRSLIGMFDAARQKLEDKQRTKSGKVRGWFRDVARTVHRHEYLLKLLPDGDKYTSVLVGAFTALIQVSVTYEQTADQISDSLEQISDQAYHLQNALQTAPGEPYVKQQVAKFYCHMFRFLAFILTEWLSSSWKRLSSSLGDTILGACNDAMVKMGRCRKNAKEHLCSMGVSQIFKLGAYVEAGLVGGMVDRQRLNDSTNNSQRAIVLNKTTGLQPIDPNVDLPRSLADTQERIESLELSSTDETNREDRDYDDGLLDKPRILQALQSLGKYVKHKDISELLPQAQDLLVSDIARSDILRMINSTESSGIWLEDQSDSDEPSSSTLACTYILAALRQMHIPTVAHFVAYQRRKTGQRINREQELLALCCSLVYQLAEALPEHVYFPKDLRAHVEALQHCAEREAVTNIGAAVDLIEDLVNMTPPLLFCLVDGIQLLEGDANSSQMNRVLRRFVAALCSPIKRGRSLGKDEAPGIFKVLVSTNGHCDLLQKGVNADLLQYRNINEDDMDDPLDIQKKDFVA